MPSTILGDVTAEVKLRALPGEAIIKYTVIKNKMALFGYKTWLCHLDAL